MFSGNFSYLIRKALKRRSWWECVQEEPQGESYEQFNFSTRTEALKFKQETEEKFKEQQFHFCWRPTLGLKVVCSWLSHVLQQLLTCFVALVLFFCAPLSMCGVPTIPCFLVLLDSLTFNPLFWVPVGYHWYMGNPALAAVCSKPFTDGQSLPGCETSHLQNRYLQVFAACSPGPVAIPPMLRAFFCAVISVAKTLPSTIACGKPGALGSGILAFNCLLKLPLPPPSL